jgi:AcrR family transcriptional regulator
MASASTGGPIPRMRAPARREQLLDAATQLVIERGFHDVSIEAIAQRAGITRAVVYRHFGDLQELLEAVIQREMARAQEQVATTALEDLDHGDPLTLMLASLEAFLRLVEEHPTTWKLVLMPPAGAPELLRTRIIEGRTFVLAQMAHAVRPAMGPEGEGSDAELTARILSAMSDEYARLVLTDPVRFPPERLLRHANWWLQHWSPVTGRPESG